MKKRLVPVATPEHVEDLFAHRGDAEREDNAVVVKYNQERI